jgi:uncharacterized alpha-E superfamily protein
MLLARVADRLYWAARYLERAEDTARLVRAHGELMADLPPRLDTRWEPLLAVVGSGVRVLDANGDGSGVQTQTRSALDVEMAVVRFLATDRANPSSVVSSVIAARENLRTTRDTVPREGWHVVNDLYLYVTTEADRGADRRVRDRYLGRVIADGRRIDGILATAMTHDEAYVMWRLGRAIERADMTTRVLGVRAAAVLSLPEHLTPGVEDHDEVQWMGVLRSVWGLQMYQRAVRGPIEGSSVVRFLLEHDRFPRAVRALLREIRLALSELPEPGGPLDAVADVEAVVRDASAASTDGHALDAAMDQVQLAIARLDQRIHERYLRIGA